MQTDDWIPSIEARKGHRYIAIVESLAADIQTGRIKPGARLLPQRDLADRLKLSVGTVSKAYAEAEQRGLISGEVGRGTFVLGRRRYVPASDISGPAAIDLALNVSPFTGAEEVISDTLAQIASDGSAQELFGYLPHQGLHEHREEIAGWLSRQGAETNPDFLIITHGAQHAISIAIGVATPPATTVLTENLTYSGMVALSAKVGYRLHGVAMDENGLIPDALETAFDKTGARALYCMPTLQTPTGSVMPEDRRCAIAEIIRRHKAFLVEDDTYAFLFGRAPRPISSWIPERSFYITSFAKCLAPGLRIGAMTTPEVLRDRCINAVRATGWMAVPIMAETVFRIIRNGSLDRQIVLKREQAALRNEIAQRVLNRWVAPTAGAPGFHIWLPLPAGRTLTAIIAQAARAGITLAPPNALQPDYLAGLGIRLCLGAPDTEAALENALSEVRSILERVEAISLV